MSLPDVCRKLDNSDATFYTWRKKYGGNTPCELKHMWQREEGNLRLKKLVADDSALRLRICEITETQIHYRYRRVHVMLRREGWRDDHKRIYSLYGEQGLSLRFKRPRRNKSAQQYPNHVWGMDFISDALFDRRRLRLWTVIDLYTRECLGICVRQKWLGYWTV